MQDNDPKHVNKMIPYRLHVHSDQKGEKKEYVDALAYTSSKNEAFLSIICYWKAKGESYCQEMGLSYWQISGWLYSSNSHGLFDVLEPP